MKASEALAVVVLVLCLVLAFALTLGGDPALLTVVP